MRQASQFLPCADKQLWRRNYMSAAYAKGVAQASPQAPISYDRFHVLAMANEAMDEVRRNETSTRPQSIQAALGDNDRKLLKSLTWGMQRNPYGWCVTQTNAMHCLQHSTTKSARAWLLKMALRTVYANAAKHNKETQAKSELTA